jgi:hypothetical protein
MNETVTVEKVKTEQYHLCHLNIGMPVAPLTDPAMKDFVDRIEEVNGLAARDPGFVWQIQIDLDNEADLQLYGEPGVFFNLSVWKDVDSLKAFTYGMVHGDLMKKRRTWFTPMEGPSYVLWWQPAGEIPTIEEAKKRLNHLKEHGSSDFAFTFAPKG